MEPSREASSPWPWPPIIYGCAALIAGLLSLIFRWPFLPADMVGAARVIGAVLFVTGLSLDLLAGRKFLGARTPIPPNRPTTALVFEGVYRYTRNPMYLGFTLVLLAFGIGFDQVWFIIALPVAMLAVTKLAIEREEAYLTRKFGAEYTDYKMRVRRWI